MLQKKSQRFSLLLYFLMTMNGPIGKRVSGGGRWNRQSHHLHYLMTSIFTRAWKFPLNYVTMIYEKNGIHLHIYTARVCACVWGREWIYLFAFIFIFRHVFGIYYGTASLFSFSYAFVVCYCYKGKIEDIGENRCLSDWDVELI